VTDAIGFAVIEEQNLIGFADGIISTEMAHEHTTIREDQVRRSRALFLRFVAATARTYDIPNL
jgi:hypothetical protein